jgi:hypothetical protein
MGLFHMFNESDRPQEYASSSMPAYEELNGANITLSQPLNKIGLDGVNKWNVHIEQFLVVFSFDIKNKIIF